jgi:hypothetical protein
MENLWCKSALVLDGATGFPGSARKRATYSELASGCIISAIDCSVPYHGGRLGVGSALQRT